MTSIPLVDITASYAGQRERIDAAIRAVVDGARFIQGQELVEFEAAFASFCGTAYAVGVGSGTA